jgi:hypothetical protein
MRTCFIIFVFFIIGCSSDSSDFPPPKEQQIYKHSKTGENILILGVGSGKLMRDKVDQMDYILSGRLLNGNNNPPLVKYDPDNADEECICYYKVLENIKFEYHIITVEELAENYELVQTDSLDQKVIN